MVRAAAFDARTAGKSFDLCAYRTKSGSGGFCAAAKKETGAYVVQRTEDEGFCGFI